MATLRSLPECLTLPATMTVQQTPELPHVGVLYRQWAVLERSDHVWSEFPSVLNELTNGEVTKLAEQIVPQGLPAQELKIRYDWPAGIWRDGVYVPGFAECVIDLMQMTQTNTSTGTVRRVAYSYKYKPSSP